MSDQQLYKNFLILSYHVRIRRKMLSEGKNGPIPQMPFEEMCELLAEAMKSIPSERVIKTFKQTLFSLPVDG